MSAVKSIAKGEAAKRFIGVVNSLRQRKKELDEGGFVALQQGQNGQSSQGVNLTAEEFSEALGEDASKFAAAINAFVAAFDAESA